MDTTAQSMSSSRITSPGPLPGAPGLRVSISSGCGSCPGGSCRCCSQSGLLFHTWCLWSTLRYISGLPCRLSRIALPRSASPSSVSMPISWWLSGRERCKSSSSSSNTPDPSFAAKTPSSSVSGLSVFELCPLFSNKLWLILLLDPGHLQEWVRFAVWQITLNNAYRITSLL